MREADRKYFDRFGFTAREFVYGDAIERRVRATESAGVVVHFVKPSSPSAIAGLRQEDWIKEIDGVEVKTFAATAEKLAMGKKRPPRPAASTKRSLSRPATPATTRPATTS